MVRSHFAEVTTRYLKNIYIADINSILEFTKCPNEAGVVLSNVWKNSKSLKTRGNIFIPSFFFATDRNFLAAFKIKRNYVHHLFMV